MIHDYTVIGGGIVGLSTAMHLAQYYPHAKILMLEKEASPALHQTGRNSGVIHSGIYYKPGSYKARFARAGSSSMVDFCREHEIPHEVCGKVIVATQQSELAGLDNLLERGQQNGLEVRKISREEVNEIEPHVRCLAGIHVPTTGITNYRGVSQKYLDLFLERGGQAMFENEVRRITERGHAHLIETTRGEFETKFLINCAGLYSDRVTRLADEDPGAKIVPFRGEYYELIPSKRRLVKTLIYPVPNPDFPFLGVHFTRMIDGSVHCGPNAVLAFKREGYKKTDFNMRDFWETISYPGFWKLARKNFSEGMKEIYRSFSKAAFLRSLQQLIPEVQADDLIPCKAGVRAQALLHDGRLVDDFLLVRGRNALHVCNAPSPGATASLEIGKAIVAQISQPSVKPTAVLA
ncbi:MAG TPA: L-2-hydroxyglutarate oxidase [Candidatus Udaeobacter sp.]|nr:L-2-hydroxyglutarate oxidase [Candidatus Udaeobacter sp.]